jgi:hypothetical protein
MIRRIAVFLSCLVLAGGALAEESADDSFRIGGNVRVAEAIAGSLHALGGRVTVDARVDGTLRAAGGKVEIGSGAVVEQDASIAGGSINIRGPIHGDLHAAGGRIVIDAPVTGDAYVAGGSLTLGPDARIGGKVRFRGGDLNLDPAAVVTGGTEHVRGRSHRHDSDDGAPFRHGWGWTVALVLLAALLAGAFPGPSRRLAQELRERPWHAPLLGFLALTAIPAAAVLMMVTIIGIPVAMLTLFLYAALLLVGYVWLAVVVGGLLLDRFQPETAAQVAWRVGAAVAAMTVLAIAVRVPYLGGLVKFAALVVGVGMIVGLVMRRGERPAVPAA